MNEAEKEISDMLYKSNRPHNVQTVINFTGSRFTKGVVEKVLVKLVESKKLIF